MAVRRPRSSHEHASSERSSLCKDPDQEIYHNELGELITRKQYRARRRAEAADLAVTDSMDEQDFEVGDREHDDVAVGELLVGLSVSTTTHGQGGLKVRE